jgi:hypothetical protein
MKNTKIVEQIQIDGSIVEFVEIDHSNGEFTSMSKAIYDELKANEAKTK